MLPGIGFSLQAQYDRPVEQVIALLHRAGFCAVSPAWSPELDLGVLSSCVRAHGMTVQSLHAPYRGIPQLWEPDSPQSAPARDSMLHCIDLCGQHEIPVLVIHSWQGCTIPFPKHRWTSGSLTKSCSTRRKRAYPSPLKIWRARNTCRRC